MGANDACGESVAAGASEAKVSDLGFHGGVEEDVGGLDVFVDDPGPSVLVDVLEGVGEVEGDAEAGSPLELVGHGRGVEPVMKRAIGDVLVDEVAAIVLFVYAKAL